MTKGLDLKQSPYHIGQLAGFQQFTTSQFHASTLSPIIVEVEKFQSHKNDAIFPFGFDQWLIF
jgi:hypothetical protein